MGIKIFDICYLAFGLENIYIFQSKGIFMCFATNTARWRIETPPKANLSAISFRPHKKGRDSRGMSDIAANIIASIWINEKGLTH